MFYGKFVKCVLSVLRPGFLFHTRQADGDVLPARQGDAEPAGMDAGVLDRHVPRIDDLRAPLLAGRLQEIAERGPAEAVVVDLVPGVLPEGNSVRHAHGLVER